MRLLWTGTHHHTAPEVLRGHGRREYVDDGAVDGATSTMFVDRALRIAAAARPTTQSLARPTPLAKALDELDRIARLFRVMEASLVDAPRDVATQCWLKLVVELPARTHGDELTRRVEDA